MQDYEGDMEAMKLEHYLGALAIEEEYLAKRESHNKKMKDEMRRLAVRHGFVEQFVGAMRRSTNAEYRRQEDESDLIMTARRRSGMFDDSPDMKEHGRELQKLRTSHEDERSRIHLAYMMRKCELEETEQEKLMREIFTEEASQQYAMQIQDLTKRIREDLARLAMKYELRVTDG